MVKEAFLHDIKSFKKKALYWASSFNTACVLDSNNFPDAYSKFDLLIAADVEDEINLNSGAAFIGLKSFKEKHAGRWMTGFLSYDLKNETEQISSENPDELEFPHLYFFVPKHVIILKDSFLTIFSNQAEDIFQQIDQTVSPAPAKKSSVKLQSRISKKEYLDQVEKIKKHISRGDIYISNFCQEFYAEDVQIDPTYLFGKLNAISPTPFACYFKVGNQYILSASPERFLAKRNRKLISQPIKGTAPRSVVAADDQLQKNILKNSIKERAENVMIVDLVRNDLTKSAVAGTVQVEELFGIYSFQQVHQMISTIVAGLEEKTDAVDAIKNTFPAGSMTGAPKLRSMQLMEQFEVGKRSIYAGSVGYFSPDGDFDLNVVIRTILYNEKKKYLSFQVGSAITFQSVAEAEYEECLLKASGMMMVLKNFKP